MVWATWRPCRDPQSDMSSFMHERNKTIQINTRQKHRESTYYWKETTGASAEKWNTTTSYGQWKNAMSVQRWVHKWGNTRNWNKGLGFGSGTDEGGSNSEEASPSTEKSLPLGAVSEDLGNYAAPHFSVIYSIKAHWLLDTYILFFFTWQNWLGAAWLGTNWTDYETWPSIMKKCELAFTTWTYVNLLDHVDTRRCDLGQRWATSLNGGTSSWVGIDPGSCLVRAVFISHRWLGIFTRLNWSQTWGNWSQLLRTRSYDYNMGV